MAARWIALIVGGGAAVLIATGLVVFYVVRSSVRARREAEAARRELVDRYGFSPSWHDGPYGSDPGLSGVMDGVAVAIGEFWLSQGGGRGYRLYTRWQFEGRDPWPGGLVAYTPGFRKAVGGPHGRVHDTSHPVSALVAQVNDLEIGDPEIDQALAIDALDRAIVRRQLTAPAVKSNVLRGVSRFGHIRIRGCEVAIEVARRVTTAEELAEGARCVAAVVQALRAAGA